MDNMVTLKNRLKELLANSGKTVKDFAESIGITRQSLSLYLNGDRTPNIDVLAKCCKNLNVSADYLLGFEDEPKVEKNVKIAAETLHLSTGAIRNLSKDTNTPPFQDAIEMFLSFPSDDRNKILYNLSVCCEAMKAVSVANPHFDSYAAATQMDIFHCLLENTGMMLLPPSETLAFNANMTANALCNAIIHEWDRRNKKVEE